VLGYFCSGCGRTVGAMVGTTSGAARTEHAADCPSRAPLMPVARDIVRLEGEVAILKGKVEALVEHGQAVNKRLEALEGHLREISDAVSRQAERLDGLEARLTDVAGIMERFLARLAEGLDCPAQEPSIGPHTPIRDKPAKRTPQEPKP
jgi:hypothetical protein